MRRFAQQLIRQYATQGTPPSASPAKPKLPARKTLSSLRALYEARTPITMVTAYDYPTALHVDRAGVDITLVGDSVAMVCLGHRTTQAATVDQMMHHACAARRATRSSLLVVDLPFGSYETCATRAVDTAVRFVKEAGVDAIKLEGGVMRAHTVRAIVDAGIAVMGHVGLLPQAVGRVGTFRAVGRSSTEAQNVIADARALQHAGAFAIVVECVPAPVAELLSSVVDVPTIGIGSGSACDGQVLVYHDMLGILSHPHHDNVAPKFSKPFAKLGPVIDDALQNYCHEVRNRAFPSAQYSPYHIPDDQLSDLRAYVNSLDTPATKGKPRLAESKNGHPPPPLQDDPITVY